MSNDDADARINPYAPTEVESEQAVPQPQIEQQNGQPPKTLRQIAFRWTLICGISAAPSFVYGMMASNGQFAAMLIGIAIFAVGYTALDFRTAQRPFRKKRTVQRTLKITYGTRIAISLLFPLGFYLDLFCGLLAIGVTQGITGGSFKPGNEGMTFLGALLTTLVQGVILNAVLGIYGLLVHGIQLLIRKLRT